MIKEDCNYLKKDVSMNKIITLALLLLSCNSTIFCMVHPAVYLETERIRLRELTPEDAPALLPILGDLEVMDRAAGGVTMPLDEIKDFLKTRILPSYKENGWGRYALIKKDTGALMGFGGFCTHGRLRIEDVSETYKPVALSIVLAKEYWLQGYATELMKVAMNHARNTLKLSELIAVVDTKYAISAQVAKKAGFAFWKKGRNLDTPVDVYKIELK